MQLVKVGPLVCAGFLFLILSEQSWAQAASVRDCEGALVRQFEMTDTNWANRLTYTSSLSRQQFEEKTTQFGLEAVIYNVPIFADYGQYHQFASVIQQNTGISFREKVASST